MSTFNPDEEERFLEEFDWTAYYEYSEIQEAREQDQYLNWYECSKEPGVEKHTYQIEVTWMMTATVPVEAESLEEAMKKVICLDATPYGNYLHDSFQVDEDLTRENNSVTEES